MNEWSQKSHTDHLGNLPVETTPSPLQPLCASPLLTGAKLHPWFMVTPKMVSSTLPNCFSNTPEISQTKKQTLKRKPNSHLDGVCGVHTHFTRVRSLSTEEEHGYTQYHEISKATSGTTCLPSSAAVSLLR